MQPSDIQQLIASGDVEFQTRCTFCDGREEAEGSLGVQIGPGQFMEVPIGPNCLEKARESSAQWVDKPEQPVVE